MSGFNILITSGNRDFTSTIAEHLTEHTGGNVVIARDHREAHSLLEKRNFYMQLGEVGDVESRFREFEFSSRQAYEQIVDGAYLYSQGDLGLHDHFMAQAMNHDAGINPPFDVVIADVEARRERLDRLLFARIKAQVAHKLMIKPQTIAITSGGLETVPGADACLSICDRTFAQRLVEEIRRSNFLPSHPEPEATPSG